MRFENSQKKYAKAIAKNARKEIDSLETELQHLKADLKNYQTSQKYLECKSKQDETYSKKANRVRIRSKCKWYESGEKSNKFFLILEKARFFSHNWFVYLLNMKKKLKGTELQDFYKTLFTNNLSVSKQNVSLLEDLPLPKLQ